ncbi:hypothetical protein SAY87_010589 [Trapa incisa]|uniref:Uncharacterized protein n=1 Tax=Trapa incisa TaxID=236973 RepID=A0AAN7JI45_9MYRT|nr:hypothetical protein SAY87_010589 [Trapa incisa]
MDPSARNGGECNGDEEVDLLEEAWFFGNLLHRNRRHMTRCLSDPCPHSSDYSSSGMPLAPEKTPTKESYTPVPPRVPDKASPPPTDKNLNRRKTMKKHTQNFSSSFSYDDQSGHIQSPSSTEKTMAEVWQEAVAQGKVSSGKRRESRRSPCPVLLRTPSLPPCIDMEYVGIEETSQTKSHPRMTNSNRQSSLNISGFLPHQYDPKGIPNYRFRISSEEDMRRRLLNRSKSIKSRDELEFEELQGFKDLGFTFDNEIGPDIVSILPGLQKEEDSPPQGGGGGGDQKHRKPYLSEAWLSQSFAPSIPRWHPREAGKEDVKAQIKFWARAVASNVRQEC